MKKPILFIIGGILFLTISSMIALNLYTEEKVRNIGRGIGYDSFYGSQDLGGLLILNYYQYSDGFISYENDNYKNKWRDMLATNPTLAYSAVDLYFDDFIESFKEGFEESKKNQVKNMISNSQNYSEEDVNSALSKNADDFLSSQMANMRKYQLLIDDFLKLDDVRLNRMINSVSKDKCCFYAENNTESKELKKWLISNGHITGAEVLAMSELPSFYAYPIDMILLTYRISSNYPTWTNRRVLQEMKKFSEHVQSKVSRK